MSTSNVERLAILGYCSPLQGSRNPTGVGQHVLEMFNGLAAHPRIEFALAGTSDAFEQVSGCLPECQLSPTVAHIRIPGRDRITRFLLNQSRLMALDSRVLPFDWVYCPKEQPVSIRGGRLAVTCHDLRALEPEIRGLPYQRSFWQRLITRRNLHQMAKRADLILAVSEFTKSRLQEFLGIASDRIHVVGNGVSPVYRTVPTGQTTRDVLERFRLDARQYLVCVGSLTRRKGGDAVLRLAAELSRCNSNLKIIIAGRRHDSDLLAQYRQLTGKAQSTIKLPGYVADAELNVLLRSSLALMFPSRYEGFGIPVVEAMAARTRVISSQSSAMSEVCAGHAVPCDPNIPQTICEAVERVQAETIEERHSIIEQAERYASVFTWDNCVARLLSALKARQ